MLLPLLLVACSDTAINRLHQTDQFEQAPSNAVDILWIVDNSKSMQEEQDAVAAAAGSFLAQLEDAGMDFHLGVVTTDMSSSNADAGALMGGVMTSACMDDGDPADCTYASQFQAAVLRGVDGDNQEKGLGAALAAISEPIKSTRNAGFRRDDAPLMIVVLSDENDCTDQGALAPDTSNDACYHNGDLLVPVPDLASDLRDATDNNTMFSGIIGPAQKKLCSTSYSGDRYRWAIEILRGIEANICDNDYDTVMAGLGLAASGVLDTFQLSKAADPETIEVQVDPPDLEPYDVDGDELIGWTYDATYSQITFHGSSVPPRGSVVTVDYTVTGPLPDDVEAVN